MGVPSYFAYIIKHHNAILRKRHQGQIARVYMDCNSILYDVYHKMMSSSGIQKGESASSLEKLEDELLEKTFAQIEQYIRKTNPSSIIFIAFDGVAPFAKMEQQRTRRYKSWFESETATKINGNGWSSSSVDPKFITSMFTPGTAFMQKLSIRTIERFWGQEKKFGVDQILLATPDEPGEGEHKLYAHLRDFPVDNHNSSVAIYGLDADLIMLSLFHSAYCENIYVFREAPAFMHLTEGGEKWNSEDVWYLDIRKLAHSIEDEMRCSSPNRFRTMDYVFLCFMLGNDFLPHFPSLNIRTNGMQRLLETYRGVIGSHPDRFLLSPVVKNPTIEWSNVKLLLQSLAKNEHVFLLQEYAIRKKWDGRGPDNWAQNTPEEKMDTFQNAPVIFRQVEKFINPSDPGWENRYYSRLFRENDDSVPRTASQNYLEGLEWVLKYYTSGCIDWQWHYKYNYPPLLIDLLNHVPSKSSHHYFLVENRNICSSLAQLCYVLPQSQFHLLPPLLEKELRETRHCLYPASVNELKFEWAFCRYLWEAHLDLPKMDIFEPNATKAVATKAVATKSNQKK